MYFSVDSPPKNILQTVLLLAVVLPRFISLQTSYAALQAQQICMYVSPGPLEERKVVLSARNWYWPLLSINKSQWDTVCQKEALIKQGH